MNPEPGRPPIPGKGFVGTGRRTWLDREHGRVGRIFRREQFDQVLYLHELCGLLHGKGVPIQLPISDPVESGEHIIAYYHYCPDNRSDLAEDGWYCPKETPDRLRNAAAAFALFQNGAAGLKGPDRPLDFPYCSTLAWMRDEQPLHSLLGPWRQIDREKTVQLRMLEAIVRQLIEMVAPIRDRWEWGLCHADYHSGNVIFNDQSVGSIVDFGFWIHHPLPFDLAIALEMWGRDWGAARFELDYGKVAEFMESYQCSGGPVRLAQEDLPLLPLARLWIEMHNVRKLRFPDELERVKGFISERALARLHWYMDHLDSLPVD